MIIFIFATLPNKIKNKLIVFLKYFSPYPKILSLNKASDPDK